jgi:hypothetical protein
MSSFTYIISYSLGYKENNNWLKGYLIVTPSSGWIWLKDHRKITIKKGTVGDDIIKQIKEDNSLLCAGYNIKIEKSLVKPTLQNTDNILNSDNKNIHNSDNIVVKNNDKVINGSIDVKEIIPNNNYNLKISNPEGIIIPSSTSSSVPLQIADSTVKKRKRNDSINKNDLIYDKDNNNNNNNNNNMKFDHSSNLLSDIILDPVLEAKMRPHQSEAAKFLIDRLLGRTNGNNGNKDSDNNDNGYSLISGAILADEMGTGTNSIIYIYSICIYINKIIYI